MLLMYVRRRCVGVVCSVGTYFFFFFFVEDFRTVRPHEHESAQAPSNPASG